MQRDNFDFAQESESTNYGHGDDLVLLLADSLPDSEAKTQTAELMLAAWTNFAKAGSPNPPTGSSNPPTSSNNDTLSWPAFSSEERECLLLQQEPEVVYDPYPERMLLWRRLVWDPAINAAETERLKAERVVVVTSPPSLVNHHWVAPGQPYYHVPLWYPWRTTYTGYTSLPIFQATG